MGFTARVCGAGARCGLAYAGGTRSAQRRDSNTVSHRDRLIAAAGGRFLAAIARPEFGSSEYIVVATFD